jgi:hypothetical protein
MFEQFNDFKWFKKGNLAPHRACTASGQASAKVTTKLAMARRRSWGVCTLESESLVLYLKFPIYPIMLLISTNLYHNIYIYTNIYILYVSLLTIYSIYPHDPFNPSE